MSTAKPDLITIDGFRADDWRSYRDLRLRALEDSPDAFGSTLAEARSRPESFWSERLSAGVASNFDHPVCARVQAEVSGLAWGRITPPEYQRADVFQMWVSPAQRGRGIGRKLLEAVIEWATSTGAESLWLGVTCGISAANRLYRSVGFVPQGNPSALRPGCDLLAQPMELLLRPTKSLKE